MAARPDYPAQPPLNGDHRACLDRVCSSAPRTREIIEACLKAGLPFEEMRDMNDQQERQARALLTEKSLWADQLPG